MGINMYKVVLVMAFLKEHKWKSQLNLRDNLGIGYLSAMLKKAGYQVDVINAEMRYEEEETVTRKIMAGHYDMVGFTCSAQRTYQPTVTILKRIREMGYKNHATIGGVFAATAAREIMEECHHLDSVIVGDGEYTILELVKALESNRDLTGIKSLVYRTHGEEIVANPRRERLTDLDSLPFPERDEYNCYKQEIQSGELFLRVIAGRGCNGTCTFCSTGNLQAEENRRVVRTPENILEELKEGVEKYHCHHFRFSDDLFFDKSKNSQIWLRRFLDLLREADLNIKFDVCMRAREMTYETVKEMSDLGLNRVFIGVESGSDRVLKRLNKNCTVRDNENAIAIMNQFPHIQTDLGFIMFEPEMTLDDLNDSFQWLRAHKEVASKHNLYNKLNVYYKTKIYDTLKAKKLLKPAKFWERHNYRFEDQNVSNILKVLEELKSEMMEYNQKEVDLHLFRRQLADVSGALDEADAAIQLVQEQELNFWLTVFEDCLNKSKRGETISANHYREDRRQLLEEIDHLTVKIKRFFSEEIEIGNTD